MSEKKQLNPEQAFALWLDSNNDAEKQHYEQILQLADEQSENDVWQTRLRTARSAEYQVMMTNEQSVPEWDRGVTFETEHKPWWQWQGLPVTSMAFSFLAITMVFFKVELVFQDDGVLLSFAGDKQAQQQEFETLVNAKVEDTINQKLQSFASEQQVILANYAADIKVQQQDNNLQLASYIMGASRQERKEDINDFIQYINAQRSDETLDYKIKFQQLEQAIKLQNTSYEPSSFNPNSFPLKNNESNKSNDLGLISKPANWTSEE